MLRTQLLLLWLFVPFFNSFSFENPALIYSSLQVQRNSYVKIRINKYTEGGIKKLLADLRSYHDKVATASFDPATRVLYISYTPEFSLTDIVEVVGRYFTDFDKLEGTDL